MRKITTLALTAALAFGLGTGLVAPAGAQEVTIQPITTPVIYDKQDPGYTADGWRRFMDKENLPDRLQAFEVFSPSMGRNIPVAVIRAEAENAPTLYALNGAGGAEQGHDWFSKSKNWRFWLDKGINVVIPMEGAFSYYMDWAVENPTQSNKQWIKGPQKWETFLVKELPGAIEAELKANDKRGILGFSMSGTSALLLPAKNPGFYAAAASYSGCPATSTPASYKMGEITMGSQKVSWEEAMGPLGSQHNRDNDALRHAEGLRGTELYISNGSGLAGVEDQFTFLTNRYQRENNLSEEQAAVVALKQTLTRQLDGGVIEGATNYCSHLTKAKLDSLDIPADYNFRTSGTHSWPYWEKDVIESWPTFERAFFG